MDLSVFSRHTSQVILCGDGLYIQTNTLIFSALFLLLGHTENVCILRYIDYQETHLSESITADSTGLHNN